MLSRNSEQHFQQKGGKSTHLSSPFILLLRSLSRKRTTFWNLKGFFFFNNKQVKNETTQEECCWGEIEVEITKYFFFSLVSKQVLRHRSENGRHCQSYQGNIFWISPLGDKDFFYSSLQNNHHETVQTEW